MSKSEDEKCENGSFEFVSQPTTLDSYSKDLASLLEALEDLLAGLMPNLKKLSEEISPTLTGIRANLDKEETLLLVERLTANTSTLLSLVGLLEASHDWAREAEPKLKAMFAELSPFLNRVRANLDKEETFLLIEKLSSDVDMFLDMLSMLETLYDFAGGLSTQKDQLMADFAPKIRMLRMYLDDDEFWGLVGHMFILKKEFAKLFEDLVLEDEHGNESAPLVGTSVGMLREAMIVANSPVIRNMIVSTAKTVSKTQPDDVKPVSIFGTLFAFRDLRIKKALGFFVYTLRQLGKNL